MKTNSIKCPCLKCGEPNDRASSAFGYHTPKSGDVSICIHCSNIAIFADNLTLRNPTDAEAIQILESEEISKAMFALAEYRKVKAHGND